MTASKIKANYLPELRASFLGRTKPEMVSVNLTERCNQRCIYCEIGKSLNSNKEDALSKDDLFWVIDQMALNKMTRLSMCGGEPFLYPHIIEVVAYAHENNILCNITSNGMIIHRIPDCDLSIMKKCGTAINISIDSFTESIQTFTRGNELALSNALKSVQCLKEKQIPLTILSAISKYNYHDLYDSMVKAYKIGISQILYQPIIYFSNYADKTVIDNKSQLNVSIGELSVLMDQLKKIHTFERNHKIKTNVYRIIPWIGDYIRCTDGFNEKRFFLDVLKKFYCREAHAVIDVSYRGGIQACGLSPSEVNIKDNKDVGLLQLWREGTIGLKKELERKNYPSICNGCCHKFSRNMIASAMKYPLANIVVLGKIMLLLLFRGLSGMYKRLLFVNK